MTKETPAQSAQDAEKRAKLTQIEVLMCEVLDTECAVHGFSFGEKLYAANAVLRTVMLASAKNFTALAELEDFLAAIRSQDIANFFVEALKVVGSNALNLSGHELLKKMQEKK